MKLNIVVFAMLILMLSCTDEAGNVTCEFTEATESQDFANGGEQYKWEFAYDGEKLVQVNKLFVLNGQPSLQHYYEYLYDSQGELSLVNKKASGGDLLSSYDFTYDNLLLKRLSYQNEQTGSSEIRDYIYDSQNRMSKVEYAYLNPGETTPSHSYEILEYEDSSTKQVNRISKYDAQDQLTNSLELTPSVIEKNVFIPFSVPRHFQTSQLVQFSPEKLVFKDANGTTVGTNTFQYEMDGEKVKSVFLEIVGVRTDKIELSYSCN